MEEQPPHDPSLKIWLLLPFFLLVILVGVGGYYIGVNKIKTSPTQPIAISPTSIPISSSPNNLLSQVKPNTGDEGVIKICDQIWEEELVPIDPSPGDNECLQFNIYGDIIKFINDEKIESEPISQTQKERNIKIIKEYHKELVSPKMVRELQKPRLPISGGFNPIVQVYSLYESSQEGDHVVKTSYIVLQMDKSKEELRFSEIFESLKLMSPKTTKNEEQP